jgi:predicted MPP superfamily phosphohydrolase
MRLLPLFLFSLLLHGWIGWRIAPELLSWPPASILLWVALGLSALLMPMALLARRASKVSRWLAWGGALAMGLFSTLLVLTVLRDALLLLAWGLSVLLAPESFWFDGLRQGSALAVLAAGPIASAWGLWNARRTAQVLRIDVPIAGLPQALHGFTVAQISDIHVGPTIRQGYLERIVARVNALGVDMVAITGDLVDGSVADLQRHVAPVAGLKSRHGSFFVTGNHEYYSGAHAWIAELRRLGVTVLMNEHVVLQHDTALQPQGASLVVAGVADFSAHHFDLAHRSDPVAALLGAPAAGLRLLLAHQPRSAQAASDAGFDLQLSGHTHGGQFWPWMHFVKFQQPFTAGLHRLQNLWVYTHRGTGYWGPPKRFGAPSEITHLRLVTA